MDWDDLRTLTALAETGSTAKAATVLGTARTTITRRIENMEARLGLKLVERTATGYVLTEAGKRAAQVGEELAARIAALEDELRGADAPVGSVMLTAPGWLCARILVPDLARFREQYPGLDIQLSTTSELLSLDSVDIALRNVKPKEGMHLVRRVGHIAIALYASEDYMARRGRPCSRDELRDHHFIAFAKGIGLSTGFMWLDEAPRNIAFRATSVEAQLEAARVGLGIALLPCAVADYTALQRLD